jgi:hypothetical protein
MATATERLNAAKQRVTKCEQLRSQKLALLQMQTDKYNQTVQKIKELGIEDINELPKYIQEQEAQVDTDLTALEALLTQAEAILNAV